MERRKVLLALITEDNDFQREQATTALAAAPRLGLDVEVVYAEHDVLRQTRQIMAAGREESDRPAVIIVEPVRTALAQVARIAVRHGVGWILLTRETQEVLALRQSASVPIGTVFTDNAEVGRIQGRQIGALLPRGGRVLYIEGPMGDVSGERRAGLRETLPANIELATARGNWTEQSGCAALQAHVTWRSTEGPEIDLIACQNDDMAMGARKAAQALAPAARELWLRLPIIGVDGLSGSGQSWVKKGQLTATVVTPPLAGLAVELAARSLSTGEQMPAQTPVRPTSFPALEQLRPVQTAPALH